MPTPSSSSASLQHTFDPQNVRSTPTSCPPEAERTDSYPSIVGTTAHLDNGLASEASLGGVSRQQPIQNNPIAAQQPQTQTAQIRPPTMDSDSDLSSISTISGLSPVVPELQSPSSSGSSDGKDQQEEDDMPPRTQIFSENTILSDKHLPNIRVRNLCDLHIRNELD